MNPSSISATPTAHSHEALAQYRAARAAALAQFKAQPRIQPLWRNLTRATDALLHAVTAPSGLTVIAVGGYGKSELFPHSDVDVLLLAHDEYAAAQDYHIVRVLQQLWDMQIPISHATRTLAQTIAEARKDASIAAALMDARLVVGDRKAYLALKRRLRQEVFGQAPREFVAAKLVERDRRHAKWGDSRFILEPNIKESKGALRDLHTLTWLSRYCYGIPKATRLVRSDLLTEGERRHYREAYLFFSTVRAYMHMLRGRADDRLTFDLQTAIAQALHFPGKTAQEKAEKLMRRYFSYAREVGSLTRIFCAVLEEENLRVPLAPFARETLGDSLPDAFVIENGRLHFAAPGTLSTSPALAVELFFVAQQSGLEIHPLSYLAITRALPAMVRQLPFEGRANAQFMEMLLTTRTVETSLRRLNEAGILGGLIPEFGRITGMMQYDGYHTYTVDEHTIVAVGHLAAIEQGAYTREIPLATAIAREVGDRAPLYLAMLCHDFAKGTGGSHAEKGERIAARIATRMGLNAAQAELAGWLVNHHLLLSETAFKRDLDDPQTITDFVQQVQSPERLRLLLLVTVADIKAVGPSLWNRWKGGLMRDLFHRAMTQMGVGPKSAMPPMLVKEKLLAEVPETIRHTAQQFLQETLPASWWLRPREEQVANLTAYAAWRENPGKPALSIAHDRFLEITEISCAMRYSPQLFRMLAGVMAWIGASIVSARSMVLGNEVMIATLGIQTSEGHSFLEEEVRLAPLAGLIEQALANTLDFTQELPRRRTLSRGREVVVEPSVFLDNQVSGTATVIEVNARDRLGLLYDILGALAECQLQVVTAHIATYGKKAVDVFYVKDHYGMKIIHWTKIEQVQQLLLRACGEKPHA